MWSLQKNEHVIYKWRYGYPWGFHAIKIVLFP